MAQRQRDARGGDGPVRRIGISRARPCTGALRRKSVTTGRLMAQYFEVRYGGIFGNAIPSPQRQEMDGEADTPMSLEIYQEA